MKRSLQSYIFVYSALRYTWCFSVTLQWLQIRENQELFFPLYLTVSSCYISEGWKEDSKEATGGGKKGFHFNRIHIFPGSRGIGSWRRWIPLWVFAYALHFYRVLPYRANLVLPLHRASVPSDYQVQIFHPVLPSELKMAEKNKMGDFSCQSFQWFIKQKSMQPNLCCLHWLCSTKN